MLKGFVLKGYEYENINTIFAKVLGYFSNLSATALLRLFTLVALCKDFLFYLKISD